MPLAEHDARLGGDVTRYAFIVEDLHLLLLAGLPAHYHQPLQMTGGYPHSSCRRKRALTSSVSLSLERYGNRPPYRLTRYNGSAAKSVRSSLRKSFTIVDFTSNTIVARSVGLNGGHVGKTGVFGFPARAKASQAALI